MDVQLDEADRILISVAEKALKAGVGRTFSSPTGQDLRVQSITDRSIRLGYGPGFEEVLILPRDIKRIARLTAILSGRAAPSRPIVVRPSS